MIYPEQRLREELKRMTDQVQPGQLRPLRAPGPGRRPRRLLVPAGAVLAGGAIVAAAALLASTAPGLGPAATRPEPLLTPGCRPIT
ncbi:MAG TPA: hypothetical protein VN969_00895 [Streptosporangiaceae bacterium]|nr:hypothetical protein [Streptosporangiaceae bacterium]